MNRLAAKLRGLRGARAEDIAADYLARRGLRTVARNFRCRFGEIDLVMTERETLVFLEVRYRGDGARVGAAESVDARKRARLVRAAGAFLSANPALRDRPCRFDVVALSGALSEPGIEWIPAAFHA